MIKLQLKLAQLIRNEKGQDMVEYALIAGFISVAAGAFLPPVADSISIIVSDVKSVLVVAAT